MKQNKKISQILHLILQKISSLIYLPFYSDFISFGDFKFKFKGSKLTPMMKYYLNKNINTYELGERILTSEILSSNDVVLEAGTSIGLMTGLISKIVGNNVKLYTIEADNDLILIAKNINKDNTNILYNSGALVFDDTPQLVFNKMGWLGGRIGEGKRPHIVNCINFYDFIKKNNINACVLDIEGAESGIIVNGIPTQINKLIIELHPNIYSNETMNSVIHKILNEGFELKNNFENVYSFVK